MNLINRVKNILTNPQAEWNVIEYETPDINKIFVGYVVPLAGASAVAAFIGYGLIGTGAFGYRIVGIEWGLYHALTIFIGSLLSVYITSLVVDMLAPNFGSQKHFGRSLQLVAYSFTPAWIGGLLAIFPPIAFVGSLFGLYGLYLLFMGLPKIKRTFDDRRVSYFVVILVVTLVVYIVIGWILGTILMNLFGLSYGFHAGAGFLG